MQPSRTNYSSFYENLKLENPKNRSYQKYPSKLVKVTGPDLIDFPEFCLIVSLTFFLATFLLL